MRARCSLASSSVCSWPSPYQVMEDSHRRGAGVLDLGRTSYLMGPRSNSVALARTREFRPHARPGSMERQFLATVLLLALAGCATYYAAQLDQLYGVPDPARYDRPAPAAAGGGLHAGQVDPRQPLRRLPRLQRRALPAQPRFPCRRDARRQSRAGLRDARACHAADTAVLRRAEQRGVARERLPPGAQRARGDARGRARGRRALPHAAPEAEDSGPGRRRAAQGPLRLLPRPGAAVPGDRGHGRLRAQAPGMGHAVRAAGAAARPSTKRSRAGSRPARRPRPRHRCRRRTSSASRAGRPSSTPTASRRTWPAATSSSTGSSRTSISTTCPSEYGDEFFELVRSRTPPGQPIEVIATRRPYDDPGVPRAYYRLRRVSETLLAKTHMPYALNDARLARLKAWFIDAPYEVSALPSHAPAVASNPFAAFRELPVEARYRLMLEEAQFTLMGFIKGPVCRGQVAVDVINDHFWVMFERPDAGKAAAERGVPRARARQPAPARRGGKQRRPAEMAPLRRARGGLPQGEERRAQAGAGRRRHARAPVGRRRPQPERRAHRAAPLRQRLGGAGPARRAAADGDAHRLSAARAHPLPAGGRLRRLRQRRPPAHHAPVHGLPAHRGRDEFLRLPAARRPAGGARPLVPRRRPRLDRRAVGYARLCRHGNRRCATPAATRSPSSTG